MVFNGRIKIGNVAGDLRAIPVTSESAGRRLKSGYLVDSRKWLVSVSAILLLCPPSLLLTVLLVATDQELRPR